MSFNGIKLNLGDNTSELEKQSVEIEKLISLCRSTRFKLMVECLHLRSELRNLESENMDKPEETSTNLDNVGTNVRLDLSVPSRSFYNNEEMESEEEELDEEK